MRGWCAGRCTTLKTSNGDDLDEKDMNVLVVFVSTVISLEMELKKTQQSEIPRKDMVSELYPQCCTLPALAVPVLGPHEDESKRQMGQGHRP